MERIEELLWKVEELLCKFDAFLGRHWKFIVGGIIIIIMLLISFSPLAIKYV